jgi:hypothetical protein
MCLTGIALSPAYADTSDQTSRITQNVAAALENLLATAEKDRSEPLDFKRIHQLADFVIRPKPKVENLDLGKRDGAASTYFEFTLNRSMGQVLDFVYNPDVPSHLSAPSSLRRSHWIEIDGQDQPFPKLSKKLNDLNTPVVIKGIEFVENSPDQTSGAYYAYDLHRTLILMVHEEQPLLISVSFQNDRSDVGRKGLIVGPDQEWNYIYTGEKGTTMNGLAWADTYMYSSASIVVYQQVKDGRQVKVGIFKWLKAGWAGMNFVKPSHIRKGVERYAQDLQQIMASPLITDIDKLSKAFNTINNLSLEELKAKASVYFDYLVASYPNEKGPTGEYLATLKEDQTHLSQLDRNQLQALVHTQYIKFLLGKSRHMDAGFFVANQSDKDAS